MNRFPMIMLVVSCFAIGFVIAYLIAFVVVENLCRNFLPC